MVPVLGYCSGRAEDLRPGEVGERYRWAAGEGVPGGDGEQPLLLEQDPPLDKVGLAGAADGHGGEHQADLVPPEGPEALTELVLPELDLAVRVLCAKALGDLEDELARGSSDEPDAQRAPYAVTSSHSRVDGLLDLLVGGTQLVVEAAADRDQRDSPAGALEQGPPTRRSHFLIVWLTRAVETCSRSVARPKCSSSARIRKISISRCSTVARPHRPVVNRR